MEKDKIKKLLSDCWDAADDYREQLDRINSGLSNFDKPTYPNKKEWIDNVLKKGFNTSKAFKLRHKPTGLFYTPAKGYGDCLTNRGKVYDKAPNLERGHWDTISFRIYPKEIDKLTAKEKLLFNHFKIMGHGRLHAYVPREDWEIIEL